MPSKSPPLDAVEATPRVRMTRSTISRESLASTASAHSRTPSAVIDLTDSPRITTTSRIVSTRSDKEPVRSRNNSMLSAHGYSNITVDVPLPRSTLGRPTSSKPASSQSMSKLRTRTDEEPYNATPKARARTQSSLSHLRAPAPTSHSLRPSLASMNEELSRYADSEPIKAFLRIRPPPEDAKKDQASPYIQVVSETEVLMHPPKEIDYTNARTAARARVHSTASATKYIFSRVFDPEATAPKSGAKRDSSQSAFFRDTTLPMVEELLHGQSGLIFTYGVTNSGKSYTVMGGDGQGEAGILPRALDVIFNSIKGLESKTDIRPTGVSGIERGDSSKGATLGLGSVGINPFALPGLTKKFLNDALSRSLKGPKAHDHDPTKVAVDRNLRYSVWVSYVEVYNEKLFDLLDTPSAPSTGGGLTRSESVRASSWSIAAMAANGSDHNGNITLNRKPLSLKSDTDGAGKYVGGLKEIRVGSASEARDLLMRGQENRAVFGTMANRASSRSHGVFTIKLVREHGGIQNLQDEANADLSSGYSVARLSIVDLAGSERLANTGLTSGDRLKEAGNINKSLMCLGQCLETLRKNQNRAMSMDNVDGAPPPFSGQPRASTTSGNLAIKKRPSIVPFRHSKLTELFQSFFTGEGRAVMIVNANPYDTGFDENLHVMKFSAVAKEVGTNRSQPVKPKAIPPRTVDPVVGPKPVKRGRGRPSKASRASEALLAASEQGDGRDITIVEDESDDEEDSDPFVDLLVERHEELRQRLYAVEMRCAIIENEVREEMANEMEQRLLEMQSLYNQKLASDVEQNEQFVNRKIDLLVRTNMAHEERQGGAKRDSDGSDLSELSDEGESSGDDHGSGNATSDENASDDDDSDEQASEAGSDMDEEEDEEDDRADATGGFSSDASEGSSNKMDQEREEAEVARALAGGGGGGGESPVVPEEPDSDSSFDAEEESSDGEFRPSKRKSPKSAAKVKAKGHSSQASTSTTRSGRRNSTRAPLWDQTNDVSVITLSDTSDASMIAEECVTPKPKRKLRKKAAVQEDDMVDQIGDSSLVEAVQQNTTKMPKSTRRSLR